MLVFQNNERAAMLVKQTNPVGVQLFSYVNAFFFPVTRLLDTCVHTLFIYLLPNWGTEIGFFTGDWGRGAVRWTNS